MMRRPRVILAVTAVAVTLAVVPHLSAQNDVAAMMARVEGAQTGQRDLDSLTLAGVLQRFNVPGTSVAVIKDSTIHWAKGYVADVETKRVVETSTLFQAASISKPVTAMAAVRLARLLAEERARRHWAIACQIFGVRVGHARQTARTVGTNAEGRRGLVGSSAEQA